MAENHIAQECALPFEAATDEPASSPTHAEAGARDDGPVFASEAEADAYWRGVTHGIRRAGHEPGHPHMPKDFSLDLVRDGREPGLVSGKLLEAWPYNPHDDAHNSLAKASEILPGTGRGTATRSGVVEGAPSVSPSDCHLPVPGRIEKPVRAPRHDGWTPEKERLYIETLADTGVVADACRAARMSRDAAYAYRRRASGRAFALGWDAALLIARGRVSDDVTSRAIHGVIDRVYRNGELVAERHRYDNRLTMAVLARLDRQAEGLGENAPVARAVAHEFDRFLDLLPQGVAGAEAFLAARFPPPLEDGGPALPPEEPPTVHGYAPAADTEIARLARLGAYQAYGVALPEEIDLDDLDRADMASWTDDQIARAEFGGLLRMMGEAEWPAAVRNPPPACLGEGDHAKHGGGAGATRPNGAAAEEESETNGMCKLRKLYLRYHPVDPHAEEPGGTEEDDFAGCEVWEDSDGEWVTNFPPPPGFDGYDEGEPGDEDYRRALTEEERAIMGVTEEQLAAARAETLAREQAARDRFFGFTPENADEPPSPPEAPQPPARHSSESWNPPSPPAPDTDDTAEAASAGTPDPAPEDGPGDGPPRARETGVSEHSRPHIRLL